MSAAPARHFGERRRRSAARLAAVQALYQIELAGTPVEGVIKEFAENGMREMEGARLNDVDGPLFADLVRGASTRTDEIDRHIGEALTPDWPLNRLEAVLRAILRAGTYELLVREDVPVPVVINEYLDIGHAFYDGKEPALINGVLDRIARTLRPHELAQGHGGEAR